MKDLGVIRALQNLTLYPNSHTEYLYSVHNINHKKTFSNINIKYKGTLYL